MKKAIKELVGISADFSPYLKDDETGELKIIDDSLADSLNYSKTLTDLYDFVKDEYEKFSKKT